MSNLLQIVMPMMDKAVGFAERGYAYPKPLIEISGRPMIEVVVQNLRPAHACRFIFVCRREHLTQFYLGDTLQLIAPGCVVISSEGETGGALCSALLARDHLDPEDELLIANSDQFIASGVTDFHAVCARSEMDGHILTFRSTHPRWSFVRKSPADEVLEVAEKRPISDEATVGLYYFRKAKSFFSGAEAVLLKGLRTKEQFYVSSVYNELILQGRRIGCHRLPDGAVYKLGATENVVEFQKDLPAALRRFAEA